MKHKSAFLCIVAHSVLHQHVFVFCELEAPPADVTVPTGVMLSDIGKALRLHLSGLTRSFIKMIIPLDKI